MAEKLNLNKSSVEYYWKSKDNKMLKVLSLMEKVERWVVDDVESVAKELISLGKKMPDVSTVNLSKHSNVITDVMAYVYSAKSLRLLNWLDDNYPGLSFHYVMEARRVNDWEAGKLLLDRLRTIKMLSLLSMIFTPMRTRLITSVLDDDDEDDNEEYDDE